MDAEQTRLAEGCVKAAHDGTMTFPQIVATLSAAGFEGYAVDYRRDEQVLYLLDGASLSVRMNVAPGQVAPGFDGAAIEGLVRWAQANPADYSYAAFSTKAKAAGCAGYMVSFTGRRVVYFGRTAETHVELFPR